MKHCPTCNEQFADKFGFCPVDGTPLGVPAAPEPSNLEDPLSLETADNSQMTAAAPAGGTHPAAGFGPGEETVSAGAAFGASGASADDGLYHLTILQDVGLTRRLLDEVKATAHEAELTWPEFKRDPAGFTKRSVTAYSRAGWNFFSQRNVALASVSAVAIISLFVGLIVALDRVKASGDNARNPYEDLELVGMLDNEIPKEQEKPKKEGAAGTNEGKGGGSKPKQEKAQGGGGGGRQEALPASAGKLPTAVLQPVILPASPKPPTVKNPSLPMAPTMDVDPLLAKVDTRDVPFGLPNSTSTTPSSGSGTGGGMGTGSGGGMGSGDGGGLGPGRGGNTGGGDRREGGGGPGGGGDNIDYTRPFQASQVSRKAVITYRPEPNFTEEARKNNVTGVVRLRAVLAASGGVSNISVLKGLPDGLTERAIAAARQIRFTPAQKDGRSVSQWVVIEYNFNIY
ncbi:MAG TPA: energy transducer TonB [Pyrinomonadaceae bacterium]|nr:energy transducer TonB [Pyrinomonadaceae bacterium]